MRLCFDPASCLLALDGAAPYVAAAVDAALQDFCRQRQHRLLSGRLAAEGNVE
jgi:hypothetical protein